MRLGSQASSKVRGISIPNALSIELLLLTSNTSRVAGGRPHVPTATRSTRARILATYSSAWAGAAHAVSNAAIAVQRDEHLPSGMIESDAIVPRLLDACRAR